MTDYKTTYSNDKNINTLNRGSYTDHGDGTPSRQVTISNPDDIVIGASGPTSTRIVNAAYPTPSNIQSIALTDGTRSLDLKLKGSGTLEISFSPIFSEQWTIPRGNSYELRGLNTLNETIYYRADKIGTIEIIEISQ